MYDWVLNSLMKEMIFDDYVSFQWMERGMGRGDDKLLQCFTLQNMKFPADLVTFTEEILNRIPDFLSKGFSGEWLNYCKKIYGNVQICSKGIKHDNKIF